MHKLQFVRDQIPNSTADNFNKQLIAMEKENTNFSVTLSLHNLIYHKMIYLLIQILEIIQMSMWIINKSEKSEHERMEYHTPSMY